MAEQEGGKTPKIIIDAKGTEKKISPKVEIPRDEGEKAKIPLQDEALAIGAAAVIGVAAEAGRKKVKEFLQGKTPETQGQRPFVQIQEDLLKLINHPDQNREDQLKLERARLLREAKDVGVFETLKHHMEKVQQSNNFEEAGKLIKGVNITNLENEARGISGWDDKFEGMLGEYKEVALLNMRQALVKTEPAKHSRKRAKELQREIDLRGWGLPPPNLEGLAKEYIESQKPKNQEVDDKKSGKVQTVVLKESGFAGALKEKLLEMKEKGASAEEWARILFKTLGEAERVSERERLRSGELDEYWKAVEIIIDEVPLNLGIIDKTSELAAYLSKEGLTFKERLSVYMAARRHLNDRYVEIIRSGGSLAKMGLGSGEMILEGISPKVQVISPEDWHVLYHARELFPELGGVNRTELNEILPDLDISSSLWLDVGVRNSTIPTNLLRPDEVRVMGLIIKNKKRITNIYEKKIADLKKELPSRAAGLLLKEPHEKTKSIDDRIKKLGKSIKSIKEMSMESNWASADSLMRPLVEQGVFTVRDIQIYAGIPTFNNSLNNSEIRSDLRARLAESLGSRKSEELAERILTVTLTFEMLDRQRSGVQGSSEARDLIWIDRRRLYEMKQEREPGLDWTVHRYFVSSPNPENVIDIDFEEALKYPKLRKRKETLQINAERGVLIEKENYYEGEVVSDFFHNVMVFTSDELVPGKRIRRNLASFVINNDGSIRAGGFKKMPFLEMGPEAYSSGGYWGYTLAKAKQLADEISSITYKKADEELTVDDWWNKKRDLFSRLEHISPRLIVAEYRARGELIRNLLKDAGGFKDDEVSKIPGYSEASDLSVITADNDVQRALEIISDNSEQISKDAYEMAQEQQAKMIDKFRMVHALGVIWPGSIDAIEGTSTAFQNSTISPGMIVKIIRAIESSRYLEGEYLNQFKIEVEEMGFGGKLMGKRRRYRNPVNKSLWK
jgi:hypothetical protein